MTGAADVPNILCAGRIYCDILFTGAPRLPSFGTETFAEGLDIFAGGGAFISAATFCALGHKAGLLGTLPAAPFEAMVLNEIAKSGVDYSHCASAQKGQDPQVTVAIAGQNDRAFLSRRTGPAVPLLNGQSMSGYGHLHIGELRTLLEHPNLVPQARAENLTVSLDCSWDDALMADPSGLEPLINSVDVFLPNESEFEALENAGVTINQATLLVVKCGAAGAWMQSDAGRVHVAAKPAVVVDTTGAGDAFNAGFLSAWLQGKSPEQCLDLGNQCGGATVAQRGGTAGLAAAFA